MFCALLGQDICERLQDHWSSGFSDFLHFDMSLILLTDTLRGVSNKHCLLPLFMPPTLKKLMGHIAFGACMRGCVGHTFCTYCNF